MDERRQEAGCIHSRPHCSRTVRVSDQNHPFSDVNLLKATPAVIHAQMAFRRFPSNSQHPLQGYIHISPFRTDMPKFSFTDQRRASPPCHASNFLVTPSISHRPEPATKCFSTFNHVYPFSKGRFRKNQSLALAGPTCTYMCPLHTYSEMTDWSCPTVCIHRHTLGCISHLSISPVP